MNIYLDNKNKALIDDLGLITILPLFDNEFEFDKELLPENLEGCIKVSENELLGLLDGVYKFNTDLTGIELTY